MLSVLALLFQAICLIGSIGAGGSFPKPLSKEEEQRYIALLMQGDAEAREKLILHNLRLVAHIAKKFRQNGVEQEDLISCGSIGLIKAVSTFSEKKGALSAYAARCIEHEILMSLRSERKLVQTVSMEEPIGADKEGNELQLADLVATEPDSIFDAVQTRLDAELIGRTMQRVLTRRERLVLAMRYGLNGTVAMPQREVANALDISRSYVSRIEKKAMEKMRDALGAQP